MAEVVRVNVVNGCGSLGQTVEVGYRNGLASQVAGEHDRDPVTDVVTPSVCRDQLGNPHARAVSESQRLDFATGCLGLGVEIPAPQVAAQHHAGAVGQIESVDRRRRGTRQPHDTDHGRTRCSRDPPPHGLWHRRSPKLHRQRRARTLIGMTRWRTQAGVPLQGRGSSGRSDQDTRSGREPLKGS